MRMAEGALACNDGIDGLGGHGVDPETVRRRARASLDNLVKAATEWTTAASSISSGQSGGMMEGMREASMVLPEPGGPIMSSP